MLQIDFIVTIIRMSLDEPCELNTEQKTELMSSPTTPRPPPPPSPVNRINLIF